MRIYRGNGVNFQVTLTDDETAEPLVLPTTGWRSQARIDTDPSSALLFTITVDGSDAATGVVRVHIDGADTAGIEDSKILWDLENTVEDRTYLAGSIYLKGQVTR
jgi:hypothetical protein